MYLTAVIINESITITTLRDEVNELLAKYEMLETKYEELESQYKNLLINYTGLIDSIYGRFIEVKPTLYIYNENRNIFALYLNITNPTNEPIIMEISFIKIGPPISEELPWSPINLIVPPRTTVMIPLLLALTNKTTTYFINYAMARLGTMKGINATELVSTELMITINSTSIPTQTMYNTSITEIIPTNRPMGYATYVPIHGPLYCMVLTPICGPYINLILENPLPTALQIKGYSIYSYDGSTLTSCTLAKPITVNPTSINYLFLPSASEPFKIPLSMNEFIFNTATCTVDYWFPTITAQLPYGYVTIVTNIGNITVPLLPSPSPIII